MVEETFLPFRDGTAGGYPLQRGRIRQFFTLWLEGPQPSGDFSPFWLEGPQPSGNFSSPGSEALRVKKWSIFRHFCQVKKTAFFHVFGTF